MFNGVLLYVCSCVYQSSALHLTYTVADVGVSSWWLILLKITYLCSDVLLARRVLRGIIVGVLMYTSVVYRSTFLVQYNCLCRPILLVITSPENTGLWWCWNVLLQQVTQCVRTLTYDRRIKDRIADAIVRQVTVYCLSTTVAQIKTLRTKIHGCIQGAAHEGDIRSQILWSARGTRLNASLKSPISHYWMQ